jgi:hypothetical protein
MPAVRSCDHELVANGPRGIPMRIPARRRVRMRLTLWWLLAVAPSIGLIWIVARDLLRLWPSWLPMSGIGLASLGVTVSVVENWRQFATPRVVLGAMPAR